MIDNFASLLNCTTVTRSSDLMKEPSQSVSGWLLTITVCGRAHCGPVCGFLVIWLQKIERAREKHRLYLLARVSIYISSFVSNKVKLSRGTTFPTRLHVCPAKTQISLLSHFGMHSVSSKTSKASTLDNEDSDQPVHL